MKAAEITIDYESNQPMTGLLLALSTSSTTDTTDCVAISEKSPIFRHIHKIYDALNVLFLQLPKSHFLREMYHMNQSSIDQVTTFGLKNFGGMWLGIPSIKEINSGLLKAALSGGIRRGDILKSIEYQNGNDRILLRLKTSNESRDGDSSDSDSDDGYINFQQQIGDVSSIQTSNAESRDAADLVQRANELLRDQENYPVTFHLQHTVQPNKKGDFRRKGIIIGAIKLDLSNNSFVRYIQQCSSLRLLHTNWTRLGTGLIQYNATEIDLSDNDIGRDGCAILADLLKEEGSSLECLKLNQNEIDDECISFLVDGLRNNNTLTTLDISLNNRITSTGWKYLSDLVCNKTDINSTYQSNHTIKSFGASPSRDLKHLLRRSPAEKIWRAHFKAKVFDLGPFLDMDLEIMPFVLAWFAADHETGICSGRDAKHGIQAFYHFIRNHWDIPVLFGFPSPERERIGSCIAKMELRMAELEMENKELREENQLLKGGKEGSVDMDSQKRQRKS